MKKKLEAELISIAHRILKLKNKSELLQLHQEAQKLYEKLSVLKFVEENFADVKPTIGYKEVEDKLEEAFEEKEVLEEEIPANESEETVIEDTTEEIPEEVSKVEDETPREEEIEETIEEEEKVVVGSLDANDEDDEEEPTVFEDKEDVSIEEEEEAIDDEISTLEVEEEIEEEVVAEEKSESKENDLFMPSFELAFDKKEEVEEVAKETGNQIIFEDFLGDHYKDLEFVKAEIEKKHEEEPEPVNEVVVEEIEEPKEEEIQEPVTRAVPEIPEYDGPKITKGITFGLNDKVGFVGQLFGGSNEDFNRVISQLNTFNTFQDAKNFIEDLVKPDYNDWKGKEDFEVRFLEVIENKFK